MGEIIFGNEIRRVRLERGLSQEKLSEGICSPSSLSRIENGGQVPSRRTFRLIMERLDVPGYCYTFFSSKREYERELLIRELLDAMELWQIDKGMRLLDILEKQLDRKDMRLRQFFEMSRLVCFQMRQAEEKEYATRCWQIFQLRRPGWNIVENLEQKKIDFFFLRGQGKMLPGDWIELWILNNVAVGYMWEQEYRGAYCVLTVIQHHVKGKREKYWKVQACIYNNMALCMIYMKKYGEAKRFLQKGYFCAEQEGGIRLLTHLLGVKMEVSLMMSDAENYAREEFMKNVMIRVGGQLAGKDATQSVFLLERKELLIF